MTKVVGFVDSLECPRCGCEGAEADARGEFYDGQPLICGCPGHVMVDGDPDGDEPHVWVDWDALDEARRD